MGGLSLWGKLAVKFVSQDGTLIGHSLFAPGYSVSGGADVVLFMLSVLLFTFASLCCSLGHTVGVVAWKSCCAILSDDKSNFFFFFADQREKVGHKQKPTNREEGRQNH